jgi:L-ascorbate metabolism protein UlaG (beta-lactamase superfamily)
MAMVRRNGRLGPTVFRATELGVTWTEARRCRGDMPGSARSARISAVETSRLPITVTWVGHATVLVEVDGFRLLTDPALTPRMAHLRRRVPAPEIGRVDTVAISHVHMDHLHVTSLRHVAGDARLVVPRGAAPLVTGLRARRLDEVVRGDRLVLRPATGESPEIALVVVPANHSDARGPHSRVTAAPVGYVVEVGERRIYFAGDTDLFDEMHDLGPLDVALLPIWGWGPTLGDRHLDPGRAAIATTWLRPQRVVPIHWGTYSPVRPQRGAPPWLENPLQAFRDELEAHDAGDRLTVVRPGHSLELA